MYRIRAYSSTGDEIKISSDRNKEFSISKPIFYKYLYSLSQLIVAIYGGLSIVNNCILDSPVVRLGWRLFLLQNNKYFRYYFLVSLTVVIEAYNHIN